MATGSSQFYLELMRGSPALDPALAVDINNVETVADLVGQPVQFSASVESEVGVGKAVPDLFMPRMDAELAEFLRRWYVHESAHGAGQKSLLGALRLSPMEQKSSKITIPYRVLGKAALVSDTVHDANELALLSYMSFGELETLEFYGLIASLLQDNNEPALARYFRRTAGQENIHLGYQSNRARERAAAMPAKRVARIGTAIERFYSGVGVGTKDHVRMAAMGKILTHIMDDGGQAVASKVAEHAHSVFPSIDPDSDFLLKAYERYIALSQIETLERPSQH